MRYYIDTNIAVFIMQGNLSNDIRLLLSDYENTFFISSVCVQELIHLVQIGRLGKTGKRHNVVAAKNIVNYLAEVGVKIIPANERHLQAFSELELFNDHHDPNDRIIIAQAISDKIPLISSDRKFARYEKYGLIFVWNER